MSTVSPSPHPSSYPESQPADSEPAVVREFRRSDRDQLAALVNAHVAAVIPGGSVSVQGLLSYLEDEPGEYIVNPWVAERTVLVAHQRGRLVAASYLVRYTDHPTVGESWRNVGEVRFLIFWPPSSVFADTVGAARELLSTSVMRLRRVGVAQIVADGTLPVPGIYGVPEQWPHVRKLYRESGFVTPVRTEVVLLARVADLARPTGTPTAERSVGTNGTRISAVEKGEVLAVIEVDTTLDSGPRMSRFGAWADIGNLYCRVPARGSELTAWLLGQAADWLELSGVTHLLAYDDAESPAQADQLEEGGFRRLTTVERGYLLR